MDHDDGGLGTIGGALSTVQGNRREESERTPIDGQPLIAQLVHRSKLHFGLVRERHPLSPVEYRTKTSS